MRRFAPIAATLAVAGTLAACSSMPSGGMGGMGGARDMSFFVTSQGSGRGADLGGLAGADRLCQSLATAAGSAKTWRAYLSTQPMGGQPGGNARDRIGTGPWKNASGVVVATSVADLHGPSNNLTKQTVLTEKGATLKGRGDDPNQHDVLTGSQPDGTFIAGDVDSTCGNWTKGGEGAAMVGHHDRMGLNDSAPAKSWNSSHQSRGCSVEALKATGGDGRLYCFAVN
jgi:hypothetical protein